MKQFHKPMAIFALLIFIFNSNLSLTNGFIQNLESRSVQDNQLNRRLHLDPIFEKFHIRIMQKESEIDQNNNRNYRQEYRKYSPNMRQIVEDEIKMERRQFKNFLNNQRVIRENLQQYRTASFDSRSRYLERDSRDIRQSRFSDNTRRKNFNNIDLEYYRRNLPNRNLLLEKQIREREINTDDRRLNLKHFQREPSFNNNQNLRNDEHQRRLFIRSSKEDEIINRRNIRKIENIPITNQKGLYQNRNHFIQDNGRRLSENMRRIQQQNRRVSEQQIINQRNIETIRNIENIPLNRQIDSQQKRNRFVKDNRIVSSENIRETNEIRFMDQSRMEIRQDKRFTEPRKIQSKYDIKTDVTKNLHNRDSQQLFRINSKESMSNRQNIRSIEKPNMESILTMNNNNNQNNNFDMWINIANILLLVILVEQILNNTSKAKNFSFYKLLAPIKQKVF